MRNCFIVSIALVWLFAACKKHTSVITIPPGTYKGTFQRSYNPHVSNVTITFSGDKFSGTSDSLHYPNICDGTFSVSTGVVSFQSSCFYTAAADGPYILSGDCKFTVLGDSLMLTHDYNGDLFYFYDSYKLKKQ